MRKSAIEWFIEQLEKKGDMRETPSIRNLQLNIDTSDYLELKRQAKEMGKNDIIEAWEDGDYSYFYSKKDGKDFGNGSHYYDEKYGSDESIKQFSLYEHKETITSADTKVSQTFLDHVPDAKKMVEISDEEIKKAMWEHFSDEYADMWSERLAFRLACKWYREQLKKKQ